MYENHQTIQIHTVSLLNNPSAPCQQRILFFQHIQPPSGGFQMNKANTRFQNHIHKILFIFTFVNLK